MYISFSAGLSEPFLLGFCTMNSKTFYKSLPSNRSIKQTSNAHGVIQYLWIIKDSIPRVWLAQPMAKAGKRMGRNESQNQFLTLLDLPNTAICSVAWSRLLNSLNSLKASHDTSLFELDKNVSNWFLRE